jgi:hypothetical protein
MMKSRQERMLQSAAVEWPVHRLAFEKLLADNYSSAHRLKSSIGILGRLRDTVLLAHDGGVRALFVFRFA